LVWLSQIKIMQSEIQELKLKTSKVIKNLWEASQDKETFESVLGPVKVELLSTDTRVCRDHRRQRNHHQIECLRIQQHLGNILSKI
jgi:hypothetical protein